MEDIYQKKIKKLKGPILIIGAAGFVGYNFLSKLLLVRKDVFGLVHSKKSWRLKQFKLVNNLVVCDITQGEQIVKTLESLKPQTIFNCSAYGAYPSQGDVDKIYRVNFLSTVNILETLAKSKVGISIYIHCGSSSEYGFNSSAPKEIDCLLPNSHYAVSKAAVSSLISYYGKKVKMPVVHLRLYSVYGPWEEPTRLIPQIVKNGRVKKLPPLVGKGISRDFIYIDDVFDAFLTVANGFKKNIVGKYIMLALE